MRDFAALALDGIGPAAMSKLVESLQNAEAGSATLLQAVTLSYQTGAGSESAEMPSVLEDCFPDVHATLVRLLKGGRIAKSTKNYLQAFSVVTQTGAFYRAAPILELEGHKAVSYRIRALENALGVSLAVSPDGDGRKKIEFTPEGKSLAEWLSLHPETVAPSEA